MRMPVDSFTTNLENIRKDSPEWVTENIKNELSSFQQEMFYEIQGDQVEYHMDTVLSYLESIKDLERGAIKEKGSAWVMAVQIALESIKDGNGNPKYDVGVIDGLFGPNTRAAVRKFQADCGFSGKDLDGYPGKMTIGKLLEELGGVAGGGSVDQTGSGTVDQTGSGTVDQTGSGTVDQTGSGTVDQTGSGTVDQTGSGTVDQIGSGSGDQTGLGSGDGVKTSASNNPELKEKNNKELPNETYEYLRNQVNILLKQWNIYRGNPCWVNGVAKNPEFEVMTHHPSDGTNVGICSRFNFHDYLTTDGKLDEQRLEKDVRENLGAKIKERVEYHNDFRNCGYLISEVKNQTYSLEDLFGDSNQPDWIRVFFSKFKDNKIKFDEMFQSMSEGTINFKFDVKGRNKKVDWYSQSINKVDVKDGENYSKDKFKESLKRLVEKIAKEKYGR